jgi:hypothetical protein
MISPSHSWGEERDFKRDREGLTDDIVNAFGNKKSSTAVSWRMGGDGVASSACGGRDR